IPVDDETLVAYLDNELSPAQRQRIEASLPVEPELRRRLAELQSSWELLGDLPSPSPRRDLTQTTIAMVSLSLEQEARTWSRWLSDNRFVVVGLGGLIMMLVGAASSRALTQYMTRQILANLPSIVDFPALQNIDSTEFLHALSQIDDLVIAAGPQAERGLIGDGRVPAEIDQRRSWVERLKEDSRGRLESNLVEYRRLPESQQEVRKRIADEIYADGSRTESYLSVIRAYNSILERWGTKPRAMLQEMSIDQRIEEIRARVAVLMALSFIPSPQDREVFRIWIEKIVQKQESAEQVFYYNYDAQKVVDELLWGDPENSIVTDDDLEELLGELLSEQAAKRLSDISDKSARRYHLGLWIAPLLVGAPERGNGAGVDLQQSFSKLGTGRQNSLEFLPEEEVRRQLRQPSTTNPQATVP
ncbi:MAG: hypothetical protein IT422_20715, partial [Pirellulaceae bacterium]|nr:hypothetical protein [Pirellulaceae bacterium]